MIGKMLETVADSRVVVVVVAGAAPVTDAVVVELFCIIVAELFDGL